MQIPLETGKLRLREGLPSPLTPGAQHSASKRERLTSGRARSGHFMPALL